jgi:hypothetical protein
VYPIPRLPIATGMLALDTVTPCRGHLSVKPHLFRLATHGALGLDQEVELRNSARVVLGHGLVRKHTLFHAKSGDFLGEDSDRLSCVAHELTLARNAYAYKKNRHGNFLNASEILRSS